MVSQQVGKPFALHHINRALHRRRIPERCLKAHTRPLCAGEVLKCVRPQTEAGLPKNQPNELSVVPGETNPIKEGGATADSPDNMNQKEETQSGAKLDTLDDLLLTKRHPSGDGKITADSDLSLQSPTLRLGDFRGVSTDSTDWSSCSFASNDCAEEKPVPPVDVDGAGTMENGTLKDATPEKTLFVNGGMELESPLRRDRSSFKSRAERRKSTSDIDMDFSLLEMDSSMLNVSVLKQKVLLRKKGSLALRKKPTRYMLSHAPSMPSGLFWHTTDGKSLSPLISDSGDEDASDSKKVTIQRRETFTATGRNVQRKAPLSKPAMVMPDLQDLNKSRLFSKGRQSAGKEDSTPVKQRLTSPAAVSAPSTRSKSPVLPPKPSFIKGQKNSKNTTIATETALKTPKSNDGNVYRGGTAKTARLEANDKPVQSSYNDSTVLARNTPEPEVKVCVSDGFQITVQALKDTTAKVKDSVAKNGQVTTTSFSGDSTRNSGLLSSSPFKVSLKPTNNSSSVSSKEKVSAASLKNLKVQNTSSVPGTEQVSTTSLEDPKPKSYSGTYSSERVTTTSSEEGQKHKLGSSVSRQVTATERDVSTLSSSFSTPKTSTKLTISKTGDRDSAEPAEDSTADKTDGATFPKLSRTDSWSPVSSPRRLGRTNSQSSTEGSEGGSRRGSIQSSAYAPIAFRSRQDSGTWDNKVTDTQAPLSPSSAPFSSSSLHKDDSFVSGVKVSQHTPSASTLDIKAKTGSTIETGVISGHAGNASDRGINISASTPLSTKPGSTVSGVGLVPRKQNTEDVVKQKKRETPEADKPIWMKAALEKTSRMADKLQAQKEDHKPGAKDGEDDQPVPPWRSYLRTKVRSPAVNSGGVGGEGSAPSSVTVVGLGNNNKGEVDSSHPTATGKEQSTPSWQRNSLPLKRLSAPPPGSAASTPATNRSGSIYRTSEHDSSSQAHETPKWKLDLAEKKKRRESGITTPGDNLQESSDKGPPEGSRQAEESSTAASLRGMPAWRQQLLERRRRSAALLEGESPVVTVGSNSSGSACVDWTKQAEERRARLMKSGLIDQAQAAHNS